MALSSVDDVVNYYQNSKTTFELNQFLSQVENFFRNNPILNEQPFPVIHSVKSRMKDAEHLREKILRKESDGREITIGNLFGEITDLSGVRVLHLHHGQFNSIHEEILKKVNESGDWAFVEKPKAYTWDPESKIFYDELEIDTEVRETFYTSVHYVVKPNNENNPVCCEIQVRTLFEEIWGEIDHTINYPTKTDSISCSEQLRVLSKLVSTGTRLSDSIFKSHAEYQRNTEKS